MGIHLFRYRSWRNALWMAATAALAALYTAAGMVENEQTWGPFDHRYGYNLLPAPSVWLSVVLAIAAGAFVLSQVWSQRPPSVTASVAS
jgi:hypothetical protein